MSEQPLLSRRRLVLFAGYILVVIVAPLVLSTGYWLSLLCQVGIMTIFALSYNMLLGQTGLLSFGHAVYYGLGAFATIHLLSRGIKIPITLLPLVGGVAGLLFALLSGYVTTRKAGTTFAMISLGIGELVASGSLMFPSFFGGEGGVSGNRVGAPGWFGINYSTQTQMYYLIAGWAFACIVAMYAVTQTPLGRIANAVRDNPERAEFIGYSPRLVRFLMLVLSGFFAGIAGGLSAINSEIVTVEALGAHNSGAVIIMAFVGGMGIFFGPIIGAFLITLLQIALAGISQAWLFYFGLIFLIVVLYAPQGLAGLLVEHARLYHAGVLRRLAPVYLIAVVPVLLLCGGVIAMVEMAYKLVSPTEGGTPVRLLGLSLNASEAMPWLGVFAVVVLGFFLLRGAGRRVAAVWDAVHAARGEGA